MAKKLEIVQRFLDEERESAVADVQRLRSLVARLFPLANLLDPQIANDEETAAYDEAQREFESWQEEHGGVR